MLNSDTEILSDQPIHRFHLFLDNLDIELEALQTQFDEQSIKKSTWLSGLASKNKPNIECFPISSISNNIESVFVGTLATTTNKKPRKVNHAISLAPGATFGHQVNHGNGIIKFEWRSAETDRVIVDKVAAKTLKLGRLKVDASAENFKSRDEYSMVFVPMQSNSTDVKLLILRNSIDKEFMLTHAPSLNLPIVKKYQCTNCRQCKCVQHAAAGSSAQSILELEFMKQKRKLIKRGNKTYFAGDFNYNHKLLAQLKSNKQESLKHMKILESRLIKISQRPQFKDVVHTFNKKFQKLFEVF